ncbi:MAG: alpha/beta hydrolase family protein [Marinobacter sp.]|nr:alpha/beta hydrolase family protein [Marinobacter sp.]
MRNRLAGGRTLGWRLVCCCLLAAWPMGWLAADESVLAVDELETPAEPNRFLVQLASGDEELQQRYPNQVVWLELPDDGPLLGLLAKASRGEAKGGIILLGDAGSTADAGVLSGMRAALARQGWDVLSLGLPPVPAAMLRERQRAALPAPEPADGAAEDLLPDASINEPYEDDDIFSDDLVALADAADDPPEPADTAYFDFGDALLSAAVNQLMEEGHGTWVMVGVGWGAEMVARWWLASPRTEQPLVWINGRLDEAVVDQLAAQADGGQLAPVLDLVASRQSSPEAIARRQALMRSGAGVYRQQAVAMPQATPASADRMLANRIAAWLETRQ